ncbi:uncharacterized protein LOC136085468 [Hydra vulgaris]|uniref:Uncharacterized protein LOC136085468 n=1 Tax=Hydra vulgaris TaxID=6087 RepID=A0ABM4CM11_HYDVU
MINLNIRHITKKDILHIKMPNYNKALELVKPYIPDDIKKKLEETTSNINKESVNYIKKKFEFSLSTSAIRNVAKQYSVKGLKGYDASSFLDKAKNNAIKVLKENKNSKVYLVLICEMEQISIVSETNERKSVPFGVKSTVILESTDLNKLYEEIKAKILEEMSKFLQENSQWKFVCVKKMDINFITYKPLKGNSYIPLNEYLTAKKAIINIKNKDNQCFKWCIARFLNPKDKNSERIDNDLKIQAEKINWDKIEFPVSLDQIDQFEKNNQDISVNVYGYDRSIYPLRISKNNDRKHLIDLLLISSDSTSHDEDNSNDKIEVISHYCLITNLSRLLSSQTSKRTNVKHYCRNCLLGYNSEEALSNHKLYCNTHDSVRIELPQQGSTMQFNQYNKSMRIPFVIYADFESFIKPINTCTPNPNESYTKKYQKHLPSSFCYYIKCFDENYYKGKLVTFTANSEDDDIAQIFVNRLIDDIKNIYEMIKFPKSMIFTHKNKVQFNAEVNCHICGKTLGQDRVRDHCHLTGKYRGAAHNNCNLKYKIPKFFPVLFHNLSGYDSHLFIKKLSGGRINCIPNNEEKCFIEKLDERSNNIGKYNSGEQLDLLLKKGIYPFDWVDSIDKFNEICLPPKESFFSKLNDEGVSDDNYLHAQNVWNKFNCKTFRDYHDLYNVSDVLLLADVFENFRNVCMKNYKLDPAWYFTSPGLAWDAALKLTKINLELISDYDMILMIQNGIRGGISTISNRLGNSNNKYMDNYDETKPSQFIQYLDANNLYRWAMSKPLPSHGFKWMDDLKDWKSIPCILEVDLDYPDHLHDEHNDYPLAPERIKVDKVEKLIPNLNHKKNYVIHYENLKLYERLGLVITKIHRGIAFEESDWLKQYIELNTNLRTQATNDFEKDFFKLMNNSVFGKTMENIEKRVDVRLVTDRDMAIKLAAKPNYERRTIFDENLIAIHMKRTKLKYNKPIYLGMSISDLSKTLMYEFHYDYIKKKYSDNAKLLFTDTDSLAYEIKTEDIYEDIKNDIESKFDTSEFNPNHSAINNGFKVGLNKKVIGMFKDEAGGKQIEEFVGLRSKLYSYKIHEKENKKCKGVKRNVVKNYITHNNYKDCLLNRKEHIRKMNIIRSHGHEVFTEEINKVALSAEDDKRVILEDGIHTLAYGHYKLRNKSIEHATEQEHNK